jgi:predicted dithiol-disulfide oxidoreductase (DUF899 family)
VLRLHRQILPCKSSGLIRFPGESAEYRTARDRLLEQEIELRRATEAVAAARRDLPPGGVVPEDYVFQGAGPGDEPVDVRLSELFAPGKDSLVIYDQLDGAAEHAGQHANFVVVGKAPLEQLLTFAEERGWRRLRLLSSAGNSYKRDYFGETAAGEQRPMLNVFHRDGETIRHFWSSDWDEQLSYP